MIWSIAYRGKGGSLTTTAIEASSREEVFKVLSKRGISPVRISEGISSEANHKNRRNLRRALIPACAIIAVFAVGLTVFRLSQNGGNSQQAKPNTPVSKKPITPHKPSQTRPTAEPSPMADAAQPQETYLGKRVVRRQETTNETGRIKVVLTTEDGLTHRYYETGTPRLIFHHASDSALAAMLNVPEGAEPAPYPIDPSLDEDFAKSLQEEIVDGDDDTEDERKLKALVRQARADVIELMKTGVSFSQILREHQAQARENSEIRLKIALEAKEIAEKYDVEEANGYVRKMNEALRRMGIPAVREINRNH